MNLLRILLLSLLLFPSLSQAELMVRSIRADSVQPGGRAWFWFPKGMQSHDPAGYQWNTPVTVPSGWRWTGLGRTMEQMNWAWQWGFCVHVPADAAPGVYELPTGLPNEPPLTVTVVASPAKRPLFRATPSDTQAEIQSRLYAGYDIELLPGLYVWDATLDVPDGASIVSAGAKLVRRWNGDAAFFKRLFHPLGSFTLKGVTLTHDESIPADGFENICYIHAYPFPAGQLTVEDVTVLRGSLLASWGQRGAVIERCHFPRSSLGHVPHNGIVYDCDWKGRASSGQHALIADSASDFLLLSLRFDDTTRGVIFQNHHVSCAAVIDVTLTRIIAGDGHGAGECILLETPWGAANPPHTSMHDNLFLFIRITDSSGPGISLFGDGIRGMIFHDIDNGAEQSLLLASISPTGVLGANDFINMECRGWIGIFGNQEPQTFTNVSIIQHPPARGNQGPWQYDNLDHRWPIHIGDDVSKDLEYKFIATNSIVLPNAVLPFSSIRPLEVTTTDAQEKVLQTLWVGWRPGAPVDAESGWYGEYTVTAFDVADKKKSAVFSRRCKITRPVASEPAILEDCGNGPTFSQPGWTVRNRTHGFQLEIVVKGRGTVKWKLSDIKWKRIY